MITLHRRQDLVPILNLRMYLIRKEICVDGINSANEQTTGVRKLKMIGVSQIKTVVMRVEARGC